MTTRIPSPSRAQQSRGAYVLFDPQKDPLLRVWFPRLRGQALDLFCDEWRKTGRPLWGNYEAAKELYDQMFREAPLSERVGHVPSPATQASAPAPQLDAEICIDRTDPLASTATEAKTEEPAWERKSG
jgi:hypothetical protein